MDKVSKARKTRRNVGQTRGTKLRLHVEEVKLRRLHVEEVKLRGELVEER